MGTTFNDALPPSLTYQTICVNTRDYFSYKEVIQPQVPLRLPCYDFTPVMNHTVVNAPFR